MEDFCRLSQASALLKKWSLLALYPNSISRDASQLKVNDYIFLVRGTFENKCSWAIITHRDKEYLEYQIVEANFQANGHMASPSTQLVPNRQGFIYIDSPYREPFVVENGVYDIYLHVNPNSSQLKEVKIDGSINGCEFYPVLTLQSCVNFQ
jgi:hypothetical protein